MLNINYYFGFALCTTTSVLTPYLPGSEAQSKGLVNQLSILEISDPRSGEPSLFQKAYYFKLCYFVILVYWGPCPSFQTVYFVHSRDFAD